MTSVSGSKAYSYMDQLLGITKQTIPSVIPKIDTPVTTPTTGVGADSKKQVQLSQTVLNLLQSSDMASGNTKLNTLLSSTSSSKNQNPYTVMLAAASMSSLYSAAFNGALLKNQQEYLNNFGTKGLTA